MGMRMGTGRQRMMTKRASCLGRDQRNVSLPSFLFYLLRVFFSFLLSSFRCRLFCYFLGGYSFFLGGGYSVCWSGGFGSRCRAARVRMDR
ncbi:hypothetical protein B0H13DRAFT_2047677, partial [Mycena leptocephala]